MKPTLIVYGDCQASYLFPRLQRIKDLTDRFELHFISIVQNWQPRDGIASPLEPQVWERCALLWYQVAPDAWAPPPNGYIGSLPAGARTIRFPSLYFSAPWLLHSGDPLMTVAAPAHAKFPYQDRLLADIAKSDTPLASVAERYNENVSRRIGNLASVIEKNCEIMSNRDQDSDIAITGHIFSNFKNRRLFWNPTNQTNLLSYELVCRLMRASGVFPGGDQKYTAVKEAFEGTDPEHFQRFIIPPSIASELELAWWSDTDVYWTRVLNQSLTWAEYTVAYVAERRRLAGLALL